MSKPNTLDPVRAAEFLFYNLSDRELEDTAVFLGVPLGANRADIILKLADAVVKGTANLKFACTISKPDPVDGRMTVLGITFRTYVNKRGEGNKTWLMPEDAVYGSPNPDDNLALYPRVDPLPDYHED